MQDNDQKCFDDDLLTQRIIEAIIRVHRALGPGFLESIYRNAMAIELLARDLSVNAEKEALIYYEGQLVGRHRLDKADFRRIELS